MLDEEEFLSPYGIRSLSRFHEQHPYVLHVGGKVDRVAYTPAESDSGMFGGNSNWRGPVWFPMNGLLIRALYEFHAYYGDTFRVECPTGSGRMMNLFEVGKEISDRLQRIFLREPYRPGQVGRRPVFGGTERFQNDPHWRDYVPFYEVLSRRQRRRPRRQPSDRVDGAGRCAPTSVRARGRSHVEGAEMRVGIATDHGGFSLKEEIITRLRAAGHEIVDFGAYALNDEDDYPDFVVPLAKAVVAGDVERGVAICGSGVGASVCANKVVGIRAALVHDHFSAKQGVEDDHLNILCMGGRTVGPAVAWDLVETFLAAEFSQADRHLRRLGKWREWRRSRSVA